MPLNHKLKFLKMGCLCTCFLAESSFYHRLTNTFVFDKRLWNPRFAHILSYSPMFKSIRKQITTWMLQYSWKSSKSCYICWTNLLSPYHKLFNFLEQKKKVNVTRQPQITRRYTTKIRSMKKKKQGLLHYKTQTLAWCVSHEILPSLRHLHTKGSPLLLGHKPLGNFYSNFFR